MNKTSEFQITLMVTKCTLTEVLCAQRQISLNLYVEGKLGGFLQSEIAGMMREVDQGLRTRIAPGGMPQHKPSAPTVALEAALSRWHERELGAGESVPDFWDDCDTSERLAHYLVAEGWRLAADESPAQIWSAAMCPLLNQALLNPQPWDEGGVVHNWRTHVGSNVRAIWNTFTDEQKIAIARDADNAADREEWD
jgi:hypothetical protein